LFALNINAHQFGKQEFIGKVKTLSQGQLSDRVMEMMHLTFSALVKNADFTSNKPPKLTPPIGEEVPNGKTDRGKTDRIVPPEISRNEKSEQSRKVDLGGLVYNIQIVLPETRDAAVYDSLFRSLKEHLL